MKPFDEVNIQLIKHFSSFRYFCKSEKRYQFMMWTITFRMLSVLALFAFVSISTVQSRSNGFNCLQQNYRGGKILPPRWKMCSNLDICRYVIVIFRTDTSKIVSAKACAILVLIAVYNKRFILLIKLEKMAAN